jgi:membrane protein required for colicin V production
LTIPDYILSGLLLFGIIQGFRRGLIRELTHIGGVVLGIWMALSLSGKVAEIAHDKYDIDGVWLPHLSFLFVVVVVYLVMFLLGKALQTAIKLMMLGIFDRIAGALLGGIKMWLILGMFLIILQNLNVLPEQFTQSQSGIVWEKMQETLDLFFPELAKLGIKRETIAF